MRVVLLLDSGDPDVGDMELGLHDIIEDAMDESEYVYAVFVEDQ